MAPDSHHAAHSPSLCASLCRGGPPPFDRGGGGGYYDGRPGPGGFDRGPSPPLGGGLMHPHHHHHRREFGDDGGGRGGQAPDLLQMTYDGYLERFGQLRHLQGGGAPVSDAAEAVAKAAAAGAGGGGGKENAAGGVGGGSAGAGDAAGAAAAAPPTNVQQMSEEEYVLYCQRCVCPSPPVWMCGCGALSSCRWWQSHHQEWMCVHALRAGSRRRWVCRLMPRSCGSTFAA